MKAIEHFQRYAEKHNLDGEYSEKYGEPGYVDPPEGCLILMANWNDVPKGLGDLLQEEGHELEWSDEWVVDDASGKAYRSSPNSYDWKPSFVVDHDNGELITPDDSLETWTEWAKNAPERCITTDYVTEGGERVCVTTALIAAGWIKEPDDDLFESGLFPGQNDDPRAVYKRLQSDPRVGDILFVLDEASQFYSRWSAYWLPVDQGEES